MTSTTYGLLAEFDTAEQVLHAAEKARQDGYAAMDAYSPFPVEGLTEALGLRRSRLPMLTFMGGLIGGTGGFLLEAFCATDYPLRIAGRPFVNWVPFFPVTFECTILGAVLTTVISMIALNGLPRPHHPLFNIDRFEGASRNKFFLCIEATDPKFELAATRQYLESLHPANVYEVPV